MDYEGNANTPVRTHVCAPLSYGHASPSFSPIFSVLDSSSEQSRGQIVRMQSEQSCDKQTRETKALYDVTTRRVCVHICAVGWCVVLRCHIFHFTFLFVPLLRLTTIIFLLASGLLHFAHAASSRPLNTARSAQSMREVTANITANAGTPSPATLVSTSASDSVTCGFAGCEKSRQSSPVSEASFHKVHELKKHNTIFWPQKTVEKSISWEVTLRTPFSVHKSAPRNDVSGQECQIEESQERHVAHGRQQPRKTINRINSRNVQHRPTSVKHVLHKDSNSETSSDSQEEDSNASFEGLAVAGQILGVATDFDGTLVSRQAESKSIQVLHLFNCPCISKRSNCRLQEKTQQRQQYRSDENQQYTSRKEQAMQRDEENLTTEDLRSDWKDKIDLRTLADSTAFVSTNQPGNRNSSSATSASSIVTESPYVDTCVTLCALGRRYAKHKAEHDELVRIAVEAYNNGLDSTYRHSRLLKLGTDSSFKDQLSAAEGKAECSGNGNSSGTSLPGHENPIPISDLELRQKLLNELVAALDKFEEKMANTTATRKILRGIPRTSLETDLPQVPNSIDYFKPGALQTIVGLVSLGIPLTIISHSWSSALIIATLRYGLKKAIAHCTFEKSQSQMPVTSRYPSNVKMHWTPPSVEGLTTVQQSSSHHGGFFEKQKERDADVTLSMPLSRAANLQPRIFPSTDGEECTKSDKIDNPAGTSPRSGTDYGIIPSVWVDKVLRGVDVPGNELVFRHGMSTGAVRGRCVTLRAKREILQKARDDRLKKLQKLHSVDDQTDAEEAHFSSAPGTAQQRQRLRVQSSNSRRDSKEAHRLSVSARQQHLWMIYLGDAVADIAALLEADIGILVGTPSERTRAVLQAAGIIVKPLSFLIDEFKRQAVRRNQHRICGYSQKGVVTQKTTGAIVSTYPLRGSRRDFGSGDILSQNVLQRQFQEIRRQPHDQVPHTFKCRRGYASTEQQSFFYHLPGDGSGDWNDLERIRRHVIYSTLDWVEVHTLLFGSNPQGQVSNNGQG